MNAGESHPDYAPVLSSENKRVTVTISESVLDEIDTVVRATPGLTKTQFWQEALRDQLLEWITEEHRIVIGGGVFVKPAGERFPRRTTSSSGGRPLGSVQWDRGPTAEVQLRLPPNLSEHFKDAVFWLSASGEMNLSYAAEEAAVAALKRY